MWFGEHFSWTSSILHRKSGQCCRYSKIVRGLASLGHRGFSYQRATKKRATSSVKIGRWLRALSSGWAEPSVPMILISSKEPCFGRDLKRFNRCETSDFRLTSLMMKLANATARQNMPWNASSIIPPGLPATRWPQLLQQLQMIEKDLRAAIEGQEKRKSLRMVAPRRRSAPKGQGSLYVVKSSSVRRMGPIFLWTIFMTEASSGEPQLARQHRKAGIPKIAA